MTAFHDRTDGALEARLRAGAAAAAWPATPDLRDAVLGRIRAGAAPSPAAGAAVPSVARPRPARRLRVVRALAIALLALLVLAGVATALGFRLPGLDIVFVDRFPAAGTGLGLGVQTPLDTARAGERPRILLPAGRPEPRTAWVLGSGARRLVTVAWRAPGGAATIPGTDLDLAITAAPGTVDEPFLTKMLGPGTTIERVEVAGARGWWIAGAPHDLLYRPPDDSGEIMPIRLAGDTLVFVRDGTLYRLESALGRDATIALAESLR